MTTWTAFTTLSDKAKAEALGLALEAVEPEPTGVGVFDIEDGSGTWEVGGYSTEAPDAVALALLAAAHGAAAFVVSEKKLLGCTLGGSNSLREIPRLVALWQAGRLDLEALVTARRPLAEINEALSELRASRGIRTVLDC